jgi:hypothetical protein
VGDPGHGGWVKLYRDIAKHRVWHTEPFSLGQAWVDLLLMANYKDGRILRGKRWVTVRRGQILTSGRWLADQWKRNRKTVTAWLRVLEADQMIHLAMVRNRDHGCTLITILNYEKFQAVGPSKTDQNADHDLRHGTGQELDQGLDQEVDQGLDRTEEVLTEGEEGEEGPFAEPMTSRVETL